LDSSTVLGPNLIHFDRQGIYNDPNHLPDIVVFDSNQEIKYAMDGSANGEPETHGTLYPWKRNQISDVDPFTGRVAVVPTVLTTDTVYGFYSYFEPDVVYTALDVNPVTNPSIKNTVNLLLLPCHKQSLAGDLPPGLQRFRPYCWDD